jgi:hypothetical protein
MHKDVKTLKVWIMAFTMTIFTVSSVLAVPEYINYQGYLTDDTGAPVVTEVSMTFRIYDANGNPTTGNKLWEETQTFTPVDGVYTVQLGQVTSLNSLAFDIPYWLSLEIVGEAAEMTPRQPLDSAPFAVTAAKAESVNWADIDNVPADILDGDDDTQLSEVEVDAFVDNNGYATVSELNDGNSATAPLGWTDLAGIPADIADGDDVVASIDGLNGGNITGDSSIDGTFTSTGSVGIGNSFSSQARLNVWGGLTDSYGGYFNTLDNNGFAYGVYGRAEGSGGAVHYGIYGSATGADTNYAGFFDGNTHVTGDFTADGTLATEGSVGIGGGGVSSAARLMVWGGLTDTYSGYFNTLDNDGFAYGVYGRAEGSGGTVHYGIYGSATGAATNYAGFFDGDVEVTGGLFTSGNFDTNSDYKLNGNRVIRDHGSGSYSFGSGAGGVSTGINNSFLGTNAGVYTETGQKNTMIGHSSGYSNRTGSNNVYVGAAAGQNNYTGNNNTYVGYNAGAVGSGSGNVFIGPNVGATSNPSDRLFIDNSNTATPLIDGDFASDQLTINGSLAVTGTISGDGSGLSNVTPDPHDHDTDYGRIDSANTWQTDQTFAGRIKFSSTGSGYLFNVENLPTTGLFFDAVGNEWEWFQNATSRAKVDLDNGYMYAHRFADITSGSTYFIDPSASDVSMRLAGNAQIGFLDGADDDYLYFDNNDEYLVWLDASSQFEFSDDLNVAGDVSANNMSGVDYTTNVTMNDVPVITTSVTSVDMDLNSGGYLVLTFSGHVRTSTNGAGFSVGIGTLPTTNLTVVIHQNQNSTAGDYYPFSVQHVYNATTPGTYTFYGNAMTTDGLSDVQNANLTALYVPNRY